MNLLGGRRLSKSRIAGGDHLDGRMDVAVRGRESNAKLCKQTLAVHRVDADKVVDSQRVLSTQLHQISVLGIVRDATFQFVQHFLCFALLFSVTFVYCQSKQHDHQVNQIICLEQCQFVILQLGNQLWDLGIKLVDKLELTSNLFKNLNILEHGLQLSNAVRVAQLFLL